MSARPEGETMRRSTPVPWIALALALATAGCSDDQSALVPAVLPPIPDTPVNAVRLVQWCWNYRGVDEYGGLFTDDYRFVFALSDSSGNAYRATPFERADELSTSTAIFVGDARHAPAGNLKVAFDQVLETSADDRPGKNPTWHKVVRTHVDLLASIEVGTSAEVDEVHGFARFYLVRGDSAAIPPELVALGFTPDSTRWWIDRWEDETLPGAPVPGRTTKLRSWGGLKALFR
jgi:hypothetical protein